MAELEDYLPGTAVPGTAYRVVRVLGKGGMGTVYEVEDIELGKTFVLKTLHGRLAGRRDLVERMRREARTLAKLAHKNIVDVIAAGETQEAIPRRYFVMEKLRGVSLRELLVRVGRLEPHKAYDIACDLLQALSRAHEHGIVHRDVKPENIFLHMPSEDATVTKLLDFGIVAILEDGGRETAGRFLGTPRYAAPEQLDGRNVSPKTDIYSAALVVFEMLAGRGPFDERRGPVAIAEAHRTEIAPRLSRFVSIPPDVDAILARALEKDPENRPENAMFFATRLFALRRTETPAATEAKTEELLGTAVSRALEASPTPPESSATAAGMSPATRNGNATTERLSAATTVVPVSEQPTEIDRVAPTHTQSAWKGAANEDTEAIPDPKDSGSAAHDIVRAPPVRPSTAGKQRSRFLIATVLVGFATLGTTALVTRLVNTGSTNATVGSVVQPSPSAGTNPSARSATVVAPSGVPLATVAATPSGTDALLESTRSTGSPRPSATPRTPPRPASAATLRTTSGNLPRSGL